MLAEADWGKRGAMFDQGREWTGGGRFWEPGWDVGGQGMGESAGIPAQEGGGPWNRP